MNITAEQAATIAKKALTEMIGLSVIDYDALPDGIYGKELLKDCYTFCISFPRRQFLMGEAEYIAISKKTGEVVSIFTAGE